MTTQDDGVRYLLARKGTRRAINDRGRLRFTGEYWQRGSDGWWMWGPVETAHYYTREEQRQVAWDSVNTGAEIGGDWVEVLVNVDPA